MEKIAIPGGGVIWKIHMVLGGRPKTIFVHKGQGGSKMSKNLSTWFMNDPLDILQNRASGDFKVGNKFQNWGQ